MSARPRLRACSGELVVVRLDPSAAVPSWADGDGFSTVTRTDSELSITCSAEGVPDDVEAVGPYRRIEVEGPLDFALVGLLWSLLGPLRDAEISVLAIATHDTDHVLVRSDAWTSACTALRDAGWVILDASTTS
ncbi:MAG: ACT domain-containing protein [Acidobacteriota bacterium]